MKILLCDVCGKLAAEVNSMVTFFSDGRRSPVASLPHLADVHVTCTAECTRRSEVRAKAMGLEYDGCHHADEMSGGRAMWHLQQRLWCMRVEPGSKVMQKLFDLFLNLARLRTYESRLPIDLVLTHGREVPRRKRKSSK